MLGGLHGPLAQGFLHGNARVLDPRHRGALVQAGHHLPPLRQGQLQPHGVAPPDLALTVWNFRQIGE